MIKLWTASRLGSLQQACYSFAFELTTAKQTTSNFAFFFQLADVCVQQAQVAAAFLLLGFLLGLRSFQQQFLALDQCNFVFQARNGQLLMLHSALLQIAFLIFTSFFDPEKRSEVPRALLEVTLAGLNNQGFLGLLQNTHLQNTAGLAHLLCRDEVHRAKGQKHQGILLEPSIGIHMSRSVHSQVIVTHPGWTARATTSTLKQKVLAQNCLDQK